MDLVTELYDRIFYLLTNLTFDELVSTFWFLFLFEIPRYYLFEVVVLLSRKINWKQRKQRDELALFKLHGDNPLVTILVPGKNEGSHIYKLATSLREQTYQNFELIVVDDGSDDWTPTIGRNLEQLGLVTRFVRAESSGGKASAANMGLYFAKGKYVIHLDADSSLDRDAIERILLPFYWSSEIKGVGGSVKVRNDQDSICTSLQAMEYLETIMVGRLVTSQLGIMRVISGAFGAFETDTLRRVGGWDIGPGLDGDLTQKIRKIGAQVYFAKDAVCLTSVPTTFKALSKQRMRWSKSLIRFRLRKHRDVLYPNHNFSFRNFISSLDNIAFNLVFDILWLIYIFNLILSNIPELFEVLVLKYMLMLGLGLFSFLMVMWVTERKREEFHLIKYLPLTSFYTGFFLRIVRVIAYFREIFFFSSYQDKWNPHKTSTWARLDRM